MPDRTSRLRLLKRRFGEGRDKFTKRIRERVSKYDVCLFGGLSFRHPSVTQRCRSVRRQSNVAKPIQNSLATHDAQFVGCCLCSGLGLNRLRSAEVEKNGIIGKISDGTCYLHGFRYNSNPSEWNHSDSMTHCVSDHRQTGTRQKA